MKVIKLTQMFVLAAVAITALVAFRPSPAFAIRINGNDYNNSSLKKQTISVLDQMQFDGRNLDITYTVRSRCGSADHETTATLTAKKSRKTVISFTVALQDLSPESNCGSTTQDVAVTANVDLSDQLDSQYSNLENQGFTIPANVVLIFPGTRPNPDAVGFNNGSYDNGSYNNGSYNNGTGGASNPPGRVSVTVVDYTPKYHCQLWKRDGARKDGFDGYGVTLDAARQSASNECSRTNNPQCQVYSVDPNRTTCDLQFDATEKVVDYDSASVPTNSTISSWGCTLYKQDGSNNDGFQGSGASENEARMAAASKCKNTNNSRCDSYSRDVNHTACSPAMRYEKPKPVATWACTLWKKDGARKDGFKGTGNTEMDARRNAIPGCNTTNNPNCEAYALDANHTQCTMELAMAQ